MIEIIAILILVNFMQIILRKTCNEFETELTSHTIGGDGNLEEEKILKIIFEAREEDLARLDEEDEIFMQKMNLIEIKNIIIYKIS